MLKLNLGSGKRPIEGYTGVDLALGADVHADIRDLSMYEDNSVDEIIAIHVIEHFYKWEIPQLLHEWRRVLKPKCKLILECPDLEKVATHFLSGGTEQLGMWGFYGNPDLKDVLHTHKWGYTGKTLTSTLQKAGFRDVKVLPAEYKLPVRDMRVEGFK